MAERLRNDIEALRLLEQEHAQVWPSPFLCTCISGDSVSTCGPL